VLERAWGFESLRPHCPVHAFLDLASPSGDWCNGNIAVSKTAARGSIPRSPARFTDRNSQAESGFRAQRALKAARYFPLMAGDAHAGQPLRILTTLAALVAALLAIGSGSLLSGPGAEAASAAATTSCANAHAPAQELERKALRKALICLINRQREARDLVRLHKNRQLKRAAQRHTNTMVKTDCLLHQCPGEASLEQRIRRSGYFDDAREWAYAESTGCAVTAKAMVARWMDSDFHRGNLLRRKFRDIGVGVSERPVASECKADHATFTAVFGRRQG
jgi:uncharacterized protein YkwD